MDPKKPLNLCGHRIRKLRLERKWSQATLAMKCQLAGWDASRDIIARIEQRIRIVRDFDIDALAEVFGVPLEDLFRRR